MWLLAALPPAPVQNAKITVDTANLKVPPTVRVGPISSRARREILTRSIPGIKISSDLSETVVLDFRSEPPKGCTISAYFPSYVTAHEGGLVTLNRTEYGQKIGSVLARFPVVKGKSYAVVVVGKSSCPTVEGTVKFDKGGKQSLSTEVGSGSSSFALAITASETGSALLELWPKPKPKSNESDSVVMTPPTIGGDYMAVQRLEITRIG